jgi:hypothetical protein
MTIREKIVNIFYFIGDLISNKKVENKSAETSNKIKSNKRKRIKRNKWGFPIKY